MQVGKRDKGRERTPLVVEMKPSYHLGDRLVPLVCVSSSQATTSQALSRLENGALRETH